MKTTVFGKPQVVSFEEWAQDADNRDLINVIENSQTQRERDFAQSVLLSRGYVIA